jgi:hypothetical protein
MSAKGILAMRSTHKVPSVGLGLSHSALVDNRPNTKSLSLFALVASTESEVEEQSLGYIVGGLDNRLEGVDQKSHRIVVRKKLESGVERHHVPSAGGVDEVLRGGRRDHGLGLGELRVEEGLVWLDPVRQLFAE